MAIDPFNLVNPRKLGMKTRFDYAAKKRITINKVKKDLGFQSEILGPFLILEKFQFIQQIPEPQSGRQFEDERR